MRGCRKNTIVLIPTLTYLDDRPIFDNERTVAEAWAKAGLDGERAAREAIKKAEKARDRRNFEYLQAIRAEGYRQVRTCIVTALQENKSSFAGNVLHVHMYCDGRAERIVAHNSAKTDCFFYHLFQQEHASCLK